jgi:hypothetical protein
MGKAGGRNRGHIEDKARRPSRGRLGEGAAGDENLARLVRVAAADVAAADVAAADVAAAAGDVMTAAPGPAPDAVLAQRLAEAARVARATRATPAMQAARAAPAAPGAFPDSAFPDSALVLLAVEVLALAAVVLAAAAAAPDGTADPVGALVRVALTVNAAAMPIAGGIIVWLRRRRKTHEGANA